MKSEISTIRVENDTKQDFLTLQRKHRYKNASTLLQDMVSFFLNNDITPRQKESVQQFVKLFREALFKKLGAMERDYFKPHYQDFNSVSGFIKEQFETTQKMIADYGSRKKAMEGSSTKKNRGGEVKETEPAQGALKIEAVEYVLENFEKKFKKQGDSISMKEANYTQMKLGLMNILKKE